jgi:quercetin dioxygenase-like cupin family protein
MLKLVRSAAAGPSGRAEGTFTGEAWRDRVFRPDVADGVAVGNVFFTPGARTHWHAHAGGQLLVMLSGSGYVADEEATLEVSAGDYVWAPPGVRHWHGAAAGRSLLHMAVTIGETDWLEPVAEADYPAT